jgi:hypothetical protein
MIAQGTGPESSYELSKPRLIYFRPPSGNLPGYIRLHRDQHLKCLALSFEVRIVERPCDYGHVCEQYEPALALFESGTYGAIRDVRNTSAFPEIPKLGFLHADAYCSTRGVFLSDMHRWGVSSFFTNCVSMAEYTPEIASRLFVWPNFVDPEICKDYSSSKVIPILFTGSSAIHYPWRNAVRRAISNHYPTMTCPHLGWFGLRETSRMVYGSEYARMLNASLVVPTCGTIAKEVVRKHFEIPACASCLITERTPALEAAGFADMVNCVFADESDVLDKLDILFRRRELLRNITQAGHKLVHSRHTLQHRDQIFQWFMLNRARLLHQEIAQPDPFGPLLLAEHEGGLAAWHTSTNGIDRLLLRKAETALEQDKVDEAESRYIQCLNYHNMPEATLGLVLCSLCKGDPASALKYITALLELSLKTYRALEPDPVEWAYFAIALLCNGELDEAARRLQQYPSLDHGLLERCRVVVGLLNPAARIQLESTSTTPRFSVHQLPPDDLGEWTNRLLSMLERCGQQGLAERLRSGARSDVPERIRGAPSGAPRAGCASGWRDVLPLLPGSPGARLQARLAFEMRGLMHLLDNQAPNLASRFRALRAFVKATRLVRRERDEFLALVREHGRREIAQTVLITGIGGDMASTNALLSGISRNPCNPSMICLLHSDTQIADFRAASFGQRRETFVVGSLQAAKKARRASNGLIWS